MTARPIPIHEPKEGLRLLKGSGERRPSVAPWVIVVTIGVLAFLGLGFARTSLDRSAFELGELNKAIEEQESLNHLLRLEVARLENPSRIAPLAEQLGMVLPNNRNQLLVDLEPQQPDFLTQLDSGGGSQ